MKRSSLSLACLVSAVAILLSGEARGNGGGFQDFVGWTGNFSPRGIEDLEMLSEDLTIVFGKSSAEVKVTYSIRNEGPARSVGIGFPCTRLEWKEEEGIDFSYPTLSLEDYTITKGGKKVASEEIEENAKAPTPQVDADIEEYVTWVESWQVSTLDFGADETSEVEVRFSMPYAVEGWDVSDDVHYDKTSFSYTLSSAAAWKGPIGKGTVRLIVKTLFPEEFSIKAPEDRFTRTGNEYVWEFSNLEPGPADDLVIEVYQPSKKFWRFSADDVVSAYELRANQYFFETNNYEVTASSELPDQKENSYVAGNVRMLWDEKAWVEGVDGDGVGESLTISVADPKPLHRIAVSPGYSKSEEAWIANNRVSKLKITLNGEKTFTVDIPDFKTPNSEEIVVPDYDMPVSKVKLEIAGVHRGEKYRDTAISYVALINELDKKPEIQGAR
ncbi:MAG: hypothetical protein CMO55_18610 [Verrucomicrobiales bacterium]|nr:hypothetical protein [Verrucomicrobiales bacterium]